MTDWRANGLRALQDAEVEVQNSREPMIVVVLTIPEADLIRDRAVSRQVPLTRANGHGLPAPGALLASSIVSRARTECA